ncbi:hypothetical protein K525DRAFT_267955 [Schizophyllum commune Loenen D]|nr:hypothetical protein K525DRAFT_267955 [Schizophyllum commune Loenen D]
MDPKPSTPALIGMSKVGANRSCSPPSASWGAEDPGASTMSEAAALRITIPPLDSSRRKQWKAKPTTIQRPENPSKLPCPQIVKRPRGRPRGSTTKRKDASSAPIAPREIDSRVNTVASSSAVTLDAFDVAQPASRIISPAPRAGVASSHLRNEPLDLPASTPLDPSASTLSSAPRQKRKLEGLPTDNAPRKKQKGELTTASTSEEYGTRWLPPRLGPARTMPFAQEGSTCAEETRPRIWGSNKADLYAVLPELLSAKPTNTSISGMVDYMPVVVLDEESIKVSVDEAHPSCCKLTISRRLSCENPALSPQSAFEATDFASLPQIPTYSLTKHPPEPESVVETPQADDARIPLPFAVVHTPEQLTSTPLRSVAQCSGAAEEEDTTHDTTVLECRPDGRKEHEPPPLTPEWLPDTPFVLAPDILSAEWRLVRPPPHATGVLARDAAILHAELPTAVIEPPTQINPPTAQTIAAAVRQIQLPSHLPPDINALQGAWTHQCPVLLVVSRATLATCWRVLVPEEYAYCFLGLFHLTGMQNKLVRSADGEPAVTIDRNGRLSADVQWTATLRWTGGGEQLVGHEDLRRPWWMPNCIEQLRTPAPTPMTIDEPTESPSAADGQHPEQSATGASCAYDPPPDSMAAMARTWSSYLPPAAMTIFPGDRVPNIDNPPISEDNKGVFPSSFVPRTDDHLSDYAFPSGWCCRRCGRISLQLCMRRRACASAACMASEPASRRETERTSLGLPPAGRASTDVGYALHLDDVRDPRDTIPLAQPVSVYPRETQSFMAEAEDGMRIVEMREHRASIVRESDSAQPKSLTLAESSDPEADDTKVEVDDEEHRSGTLLATHIFTCNMRSLQSDADQLFLDVQRHADLRRSRVSDNIFRCELIVVPASSSESGEQTSFEVASTDGLSRRLHDHIVDRAYEYTDEEADIPIRRLLCIAGIGAGSRKLPDTFSATKHPIVVLCLGCDARMTISSSKLGPAKGLKGKVKAEEDEDIEEERASDTKAKAADAGKKAAELSVGMVHGDVLVLKNDVYQISFKRTGSSIIVVGCP